MPKEKVFITGASKGIGRAIAGYFASEGYEVIGTCRNPDDVKDKINGVKYLSMNLNNPEDIDRCCSEAGEVDILINNAGQSQLGPVEDTSVEKYRQLYEINLFGMIRITKHFLPSMRKKRKGTIINVGSMTGSFPLPFYSSYCSTKSAVQYFTLCLRQEVKQFGLKVVLVEPNDIKTTIVPEFITEPEGEYIKYASAVREKVRKNMEKSDDPVVVANLIKKIINKKNPAPKYVVGGSGPMLIFLKRFFPDKLTEKVTMKMYGL